VVGLAVAPGGGRRAKDLVEEEAPGPVALFEDVERDRPGFGAALLDQRIGQLGDRVSLVGPRFDAREDEHGGGRVGKARPASAARGNDARGNDARGKRTY